MKWGWLDYLVGLTLAGLCIFTFVQCGNNNAKKTLVFTSSPNPSIVIESDYIRTTVTNGTSSKETYKGPWTIWNYAAMNVSTSTITVFAIHYDGTAMGKTFKGDLTGSDARIASDILFTLSPGESTTGKIYIFALPGRDQINMLNYYFRAKAIGWYGPPETPEKSFKSTFSFRASE